MRKLTVAILSLSSFMLHAQASTPAQTQVASNGSAPQVSRVSSGVTPPKLISTVDVVAETTGGARLLNNDYTVVVGMIVDKTGKPEDLKIVRSGDPRVDASVLAAVSQYRFTPGMVSNQPIATPLNLEVVYCQFSSVVASSSRLAKQRADEKPPPVAFSDGVRESRRSFAIRAAEPHGIFTAD